MPILNVSYVVPTGTTTVRGGLGSAVVAPFIITNPAAATVIAGGTATFTVVAGGDAPLTYQWRKDGSNISGATASSYTTPVLVEGDDGDEFDVVVSGPGGSPATSAEALLTVQAAAAPAGVGVITQYSRAITGARLISFMRDWDEGGAYEREQRHTVYDSTVSSTHNVRVRARAGSFRGSSYTLLVNNQAGTTVLTVGPVTTTPNVTQTTLFVLDVTSLSEGWHVLDIQGGVSGEVVIPYAVFIKKNATVAVQPTLMPSWVGSYEMALFGVDYKMAWVPAQFTPNVLPLPARTVVESGASVTAASMYAEQLIFSSASYVRRPVIDKHGVMTTASPQSYHIYLQFARMPFGVHLVDGPRGVATSSMITHIQPAEALINGVRRRTTYFTSPWSLRKIDPEGNVITLAGYRWKDMNLYWEDALVLANDPTDAVAPNPANPPGTLELVGDWSAIPSNRRGFWSIWGFCWDPRTVGIDTNAPFQDTPEGPEQPHPGDVVGYIADTQNNRIVKIRFDGQDRSLPPVLTELIMFGNAPNGLAADPWDVVFNPANNTIIVSLRRLHQINVYNADDGSFVETLVQGQDLGTVSPNRTSYLYAGAPFDQAKQPTAAGIAARAANCVIPEALVIQDGVVYWSSNITTQIKKIDLATRAISVHGSWLIETGEDYTKMGISDGTILPRGSIVHCSWSQGHNGWPRIFNPDGSRNNSFWGSTGERVFRGRIPNGIAGAGNYASAWGIGYGRIVGGSNQDGIYELSLAQASDPPAFNNTAIVNAFNGTNSAFESNGLRVLFAGKTNWYGTPLPWGLTAGLDEYLRMIGHPIPPTSITEQPVDVSVPAGQTAQITLKAYGAGLTFQPQQLISAVWTNVGSPISSGQTMLFSTQILAPADNGRQYRFIVAGTNGSVTSATVTVTVTF